MWPARHHPPSAFRYWSRRPISSVLGLFWPPSRPLPSRGDAAIRCRTHRTAYTHEIFWYVPGILSIVRHMHRCQVLKDGVVILRNITAYCVHYVRSQVDPAHWAIGPSRTTLSPPTRAACSSPSCACVSHPRCPWPCQANPPCRTHSPHHTLRSTISPFICYNRRHITRIVGEIEVSRT